jgi:hypothetical protein
LASVRHPIVIFLDHSTVFGMELEGSAAIGVAFWSEPFAGFRGFTKAAANASPSCVNTASHHSNGDANK